MADTTPRNLTGAAMAERIWNPERNAYEIVKHYPAVDNVGYVTEPEELKAKSIIDEQLTEIIGGGFTVRVTGFFIALQIYTRPEEFKEITRADGVKQTLFLPQKATQGDKYQAATALVIGVGKQAYKGFNADGSPKFPEGPWCRVGDWVMIPRYECHLFMFTGPNGKQIPFGMLPDDRIMGVIKDPKDVEAVHLKDEF
jgi:hypothetical protein